MPLLDCKSKRLRVGLSLAKNGFAGKRKGLKSSAFISDSKPKILLLVVDGDGGHGFALQVGSLHVYGQGFSVGGRLAVGG